MRSRLRIYTYHYVRDPSDTSFPRLRALDVNRFEAQLRYLRRHHEPVGLEEVKAALIGETKLPPRAVLLTFDDGYADHYRYVLPLLVKHKIRGLFFPIAQASSEGRLVDINRIHVLLACSTDPKALLRDLFAQIDRLRPELSLPERAHYTGAFHKPSRFDDAETALFKAILQKGLKPSVRRRILASLWEKHVGLCEAAVAKGWYLTLPQIQEMRAEGMHFGGHGFSHERLSSLSDSELREELELTAVFLSGIGVAPSGWAFCYPHGDYDARVLGELPQRGCAVAFTVTPCGAELEPANALTLPRFDANDLVPF